MKAPTIKLNPTAIRMFFLAHGEKLAGAVVAFVAVLLAYGGIHAVRVRSVSGERRPEVIVEEATKAESNLVKEKAVPATLMIASTSLSADLQPWRSPQIQSPPTLALLDRPLFDADAKRTQPDIYPVEQLVVSTGLMILPQRVAAPADPEFPEDNETPATDRTTPRRGKPFARNPRGKNSPALSAEQGNPLGGTTTPDPSNLPQTPPARVKVVPYAVVTGLIPARKQFDEYLRRFGNASFQDPRRDSPVWSDYEVDRCLVTPDGDDEWVTLDLNALWRAQVSEWTSAVPDIVPAIFQLGADEERRSRPDLFPLCGPLPVRENGNWEEEMTHPWVTRTAKEMTDQQIAAAAKGREPQTSSAAEVFQGQPGGPAAFGAGGPGSSAMSFPGMPSPGISAPAGMMPGSAMMPDAAMMSGSPMMGMGAVAGNAMMQRPEFRLFRFIDTTVEPNQRYRYRVRLRVWNPNWHDNAEQMRPHVSDVAITKEQRLRSPDSAVSYVVRTPSLTSVLLAMLPSEEAKRLVLKPGIFEVLLLSPAGKTGNLTLRSALLETGSLANVLTNPLSKEENKKPTLPAKKGEKPPPPKFERWRGEEAASDLLLVDASGEQIQIEPDPQASTVKKEKKPAEPLEMLFMRADGSFELVSAADSQPTFLRYKATLPDPDDKRRPQASQQGADIFSTGLPNPYGSSTSQ